MRPHARLQAEVLVTLSRAGWFAWPAPSGQFRMSRSEHRLTVGRKGQADILAVRPPDGHLVAIEIKTGSGRQSAAQRRWQLALERVGGTYLIVRSLADLDDLFAA